MEHPVPAQEDILLAVAAVAAEAPVMVNLIPQVLEVLVAEVLVRLILEVDNQELLTLVAVVAVVELLGAVVQE